jgi:hypothetical protein
VIVVLGVPRAVRADDGSVSAGGRVVAVAAAAVTAGTAVEIAGRIGDDADGDAVVLDLADRGMGHAALLRVGGLATPGIGNGLGQELPAADAELALRYLPGYRVVVVADDVGDETLAAAAAAASWAGAHLVVIAASDREPPGLPSASTVLVAPADDGEGAFEALVGAYAAGLDRGEPAERAFADRSAVFNPERID